MSAAKIAHAYAYDEDGRYYRPRDAVLEGMGGRIVASSNDGERDVSFSPTDTWEFPDGSRLEVAYSDATVL